MTRPRGSSEVLRLNSSLATAGSLTRASFTNLEPQVAHRPNSKHNKYVPNRLLKGLNTKIIITLKYLVQGMALVVNIMINIQYLLVVVVFIIHLGCHFSINSANSLFASHRWMMDLILRALLIIGILKRLNEHNHYFYLCPFTYLHLNFYNSVDEIIFKNGFKV